MWEKISELKASLHKYLDQSSMPLLPTRVEVRKIIKCLEVLNEYVIIEKHVITFCIIVPTVD